MRPLTTGCLILLAAVGLTVVFWLPLWQGGGFVGGDVYSYYFPQKTFYAERLQAGEFPLWHNRTGFGYPLVGESQTGVFYPFHLLFYSTLDVNPAYNANHVLHYILAYAFAALYALRFGLRLPAALFAALVYAYGWFPSRCCVEWAIIGGTWLPAALWCAESFIQSRYWRYAIGMSVVLAIQMLAGHFQIGFITQLVLIAYIPARLWLVRDEEHGDDRKNQSLGILAAAMLLGFSLAAIQLMPTWELKQHSQRASVGKNHELEFGSIPAWYWTQAVAPWHWYTPLIDRNDKLQTGDGNHRRTNEIEAHLYFGLVPLALAVCGIVSAITRRDRRRLLWCGLGLAALVYTPGWLLPVTQHLPGFSFFQGPGRFGIVTAFAVAVLAGSAMQELLEKMRTTTVILIAAASTGSLFSGILLTEDVAFVFREFHVHVPLTVGNDDLTTLTMKSGAFAVSCLTLTGLLLLFRAPNKRHIATNLLCLSFCAATVIDLWLVSRLITTSWMLKDPPINHLVESPVREILSAESEPVRLFSPSPNFPNVLGVASTPVYLTFGPAEYVDAALTMPSVLEGEASSTSKRIDWLQKSGVTHVLSFDELDQSTWPVKPLWQGFDPVLNRALARSEPIYLYKLKESRGRISWEARQSNAFAEIKDYSANGIVVDVDSKTGGRLVFIDLSYPGWSVAIDEKTVESVTVEELFRGVDVPAGEHTVVWKYEPRSVFWGAVISAVSLLLLAAIAHVRYWHFKRRARTT